MRCLVIQSSSLQLTETSCQLVGCAGLIDQPFDTDASVASVEKYEGFSNPLAALLEVADGWMNF